MWLQHRHEPHTCGFSRTLRKGPQKDIEMEWLGNERLRKISHRTPKERSVHKAGTLETRERGEDKLREI